MTGRPGSRVGAEPSGPPPRGLSFEQFRAWCDEDTYAEWVDGEVVPTAPASLGHQDLLSVVERLVGGSWRPAASAESTSRRS